MKRRRRNILLTNDDGIRAPGLLALAQAIGAQRFIAMLCLNLAEDDISLGQLSTAQTGLREGLALAVRLGMSSFAVPGVMYFGHLAYAEGQAERALALWGLAQRHPAWSSDNQYELDAALARLGLDPAVVRAGLARGTALDWDKTVQALLQADAG